MAEDLPVRRASRRRGVALLLAVIGLTLVACGGGDEKAETSDTSAPPTSDDGDSRVTFEYHEGEFDDGPSTTDRDGSDPDDPDRSSTSSSRPDERQSTTTRPRNQQVTTTPPNRPNQTATTARPQPTTTRPRATTTTRPRTTTTVSSLPRCGNNYHVIGLRHALCRDGAGQPDETALPNSGAITCATLAADGMTQVHLLPSEGDPPYKDPLNLDGNDADTEGCNE
jgi:hypothetical protein